MRLWLAAAILLTLPSVAQAQTHYCDTTPPSTATRSAGDPWTWQVCFANKDANGNTALPQGWALYDTLGGNTVRSTPPFVPGTTSPVSGLQLYTFATTVPSVAGGHSVQVAAITTGGEGAKSAPFVLTVTPPITVAATPVKLSGQ